MENATVIEIPGRLADTMGAITLRALAQAIAESSGETIVIDCRGGDLHDGLSYCSRIRHKTEYEACRTLQKAFLPTEISA